MISQPCQNPKAVHARTKHQAIVISTQWVFGNNPCCPNRLFPGYLRTHEVTKDNFGTKPRRRQPPPPHHLEKDSASPCPWHMSAMSTGSSVPLARTPGVISMSSSTASTELPLFHPLVVTPVAPACRASPKLRKLPRPPSPVVVASNPSPRLPSLRVSQVPWMPTHDRASGRNMTKPPVRGHAQVNRTREVAHPLPSRRPCLLSYFPVMVDECVRPKPKTAMVSQYQSPIRTRPAIITPSALRRRKQYLSNRCLFPFFVVPTICTAAPPLPPTQLVRGAQNNGCEG